MYQNRNVNVKTKDQRVSKEGTPLLTTTKRHKPSRRASGRASKEGTLVLTTAEMQPPSRRALGQSSEQWRVTWEESFQRTKEARVFECEN